WELAHGTDVAVGLEELAQGYIGALLPETHRRFERAFQHNPRLANGLDGLGRHSGGESLLEDAGAGVPLLPFNGRARGGNDPSGGCNDFRPDPVARDHRDQFLSLRGKMEIQGSSPQICSFASLPRPGSEMTFRTAHSRPARRKDKTANLIASRDGCKLCARRGQGPHRHNHGAETAP